MAQGPAPFGFIKRCLSLSASLVPLRFSEQTDLGMLKQMLEKVVQ